MRISALRGSITLSPRSGGRQHLEECSSRARLGLARATVGRERGVPDASTTFDETNTQTPRRHLERWRFFSLENLHISRWRVRKRHVDQKSGERGHIRNLSRDENDTKTTTACVCDMRIKGYGKNKIL